MEFKDVIKQRRAVNFFDPTKNVTDAQLKQIIETAALAVAPAEVQQTAKRLLPLVGNKVHATSEWSNRVRKLFRFNP
ncbi:MAG: hypothetical protein GYA70_00160, partial [Deltaproteobacteria bacterium]|nr:hypothetical protein [Deltaproteobacteria bacterium]